MTSNDTATKHRFVVWICVLETILLAIGQWILLGYTGSSEILPGQVLPSDVVLPFMTIGFVVIGGLVITRGGPVRYGWVLVAFGLVRGTIALAGTYAVLAFENGWSLLGLAVWVQDLYTIGWLLGLLLLPSLFPDGRPASEGWSRAVRVTAWGWIVWTTVWAFLRRQATNWFEELEIVPQNAAGFIPLSDTFEPLVNLSWASLGLASLVIGLGSLRRRWKDSGMEVRQQIKWVTLGFTFLILGQLVDTAIFVFAGFSGLRWIVNLTLAVVSVAFVIVLGFAVLRYRLYDVDVAINRTVVYVLLSIGVVVIYVGVVALVETLVPEERTLPVLVAAGLVAMLFGPLRTWLQHRVNRVMFGSRDDPLAVISEAGRLVAEIGSPEVALQSLTEAVAGSLVLRGAAIEVEEAEGWRDLARTGATPDDTWSHFPLRHQGKMVGRFSVAPRSPRETLHQKDVRLLEAVADSAGAAVRAVRLTTVLQNAREQLVLAREEERKRIRRDLHDGLGPSLASQTFQFDAVLDRLHDDPAGAVDLVMALKERNQELIADIRRLVYELRPPALDELGVVGAIVAYTAQVEPSSLAFEIVSRPDPLPLLPAAVEVAAYRIVREAITNVVRHSNGSRCCARFELTDARLALAVEDNGTGIPAGVSPGVGLHSMRERAEELGGTFAVLCSATGTKVRVTLPLGTAIGKPSDGEEVTVSD